MFTSSVESLFVSLEGTIKQKILYQFADEKRDISCTQLKEILREIQFSATDFNLMVFFLTHTVTLLSVVFSTGKKQQNHVSQTPDLFQCFIHLSIQAFKHISLRKDSGVKRHRVDRTLGKGNFLHKSGDGFHFICERH